MVTKLAICVLLLVYSTYSNASNDFSTTTTATVGAYLGYLGTQNFTGLASLMDPSISLTSPGNSAITPWSGTFVGQNAVVGWYGSFVVLAQVNNTAIANYVSNTTGVVITHYYWKAVSTQVLFSEVVVDVLEVSPTTGLVTSILNNRDTFPATCALTGKTSNLVPLIPLPALDPTYPESDTRSTLENFFHSEETGNIGDYIVETPDWYASGDPQVIPWAGIYNSVPAVIEFYEALGSALSFTLTPLRVIVRGNYMLFVASRVNTVRANNNTFPLIATEMLVVNNGRFQTVLNVEDTYYAAVALHSSAPTVAPTGAPTVAPTPDSKEL
jgi:hypothetical protein